MKLVNSAFYRYKISELPYTALGHMRTKKDFAVFAKRYAGYSIEARPNVSIQTMYDRLHDYLTTWFYYYDIRESKDFEAMEFQ